MAPSPSTYPKEKKASGAPQQSIDVWRLLLPFPRHCPKREREGESGEQEGWWRAWEFPPSDGALSYSHSSSLKGMEY